MFRAFNSYCSAGADEAVVEAYHICVFYLRSVSDVRLPWIRHIPKDPTTVDPPPTPSQTLILISQVSSHPATAASAEKDLPLKLILLGFPLSILDPS